MPLMNCLNARAVAILEAVKCNDGADQLQIYKTITIDITTRLTAPILVRMQKKVKKNKRNFCEILQNNACNVMRAILHFLANNHKSNKISFSRGLLFNFPCMKTYFS